MLLPWNTIAFGNASSNLCKYLYAESTTSHRVLYSVQDMAWHCNVHICKTVRRFLLFTWYTWPIIIRIHSTLNANTKMKIEKRKKKKKRTTTTTKKAAAAAHIKWPEKKEAARKKTYLFDDITYMMHSNEACARLSTRTRFSVVLFLVAHSCLIFAICRGGRVYIFALSERMSMNWGVVPLKL